MTSSPTNSVGPFLPTSTFFPEDFNEFRIKFLSLWRDLANATNTRDVGVFNEREFISGQTWSSSNPQIARSSYRKIFFLGAVAAGGTSTFAHGITQFSTLTFTSLGGTVITSAATFNKRPIPYVSVSLVTNQIQIDADDTNVRVINGATAPNITSGIVVLEYLKN